MTSDVITASRNSHWNRPCAWSPNAAFAPSSRHPGKGKWWYCLHRRYGEDTALCSRRETIEQLKHYIGGGYMA